MAKRTNVAIEYPARTDTNGNTWYRPERPPGTGLSQWGWTAEPSLAHPDYATVSNKKTRLGRIETQMDKRRKIMEDMVIKHGIQECLLSTVYVINKGRYEGMAGTLAILRDSTLTEEVERSNARLGIS